MLIGMDTAGRLTGVIVDRHTEPYGDFSIEPPGFGAQFKGKSVRDRFEVGADVDAVSRATITIRAAAREVRDSARMVARAVPQPFRSPPLRRARFRAITSGVRRERTRPFTCLPPRRFETVQRSRSPPR